MNSDLPQTRKYVKKNMNLYSYSITTKTCKRRKKLFISELKNTHSAFLLQQKTNQEWL